MSKTQKPIIKDGAYIDLGATAEKANKNVDRHKGVPVHACGAVSYRDCPCWVCTKENCAACMASLI